MGCDIHTFVERKEEGKWKYFKDQCFTNDEFDKQETGSDKGSSPFNFRSYPMFGFLAGVRDSFIDPISFPRGLPYNSDYIDENREVILSVYNHSHSWLSARELIDFNYDQLSIEDYDGEDYTISKPDTYRKYLPERYFLHLKELSEIKGELRIVFWFDS